MDVNSKIQITLQSPFTWNIEERLVLEYVATQEPKLTREDDPTLAIMNTIFNIYMYFVQNQHDAALKEVKRLEEDWSELDKNHHKMLDDSISLEVLRHIKDATKYEFYKRTEKQKAAQIADTLSDANNFKTNEELGTLQGCKCIVWTMFHESTLSATRSLAIAAVEYSPSCSLWHFLLGKILRKIRFIECGCINRPTNREREAFEKCYYLSKLKNLRNYLLYTYTAQMYKENGQKEKSKQIYFDVYKRNSQNLMVNLLLAKAFMQFRIFDVAKECLDKAENLLKPDMMDNSMFYHYKGMYYEKIKNYEEAIVNLEHAVKYGNYPADMQLARLKFITKKDFNYINHLKNMLEKYPLHQQKILLHIAMQYHKKTEVEKALKYFLNGILVDTNSNVLKDFCNSTVDWKQYNIYKFVLNLKHSLDKNSPIFNHMEETIKRLTSVCKDKTQNKNNNHEFIQKFNNLNI